jgi:hypothetical protein
MVYLTASQQAAHGTFLARACHSCGCGIQVSNLATKAKKDSAGIDCHSQWKSGQAACQRLAKEKRAERAAGSGRAAGSSGRAAGRAGGVTGSGSKGPRKQLALLQLCAGDDDDDDDDDDFVAEKSALPSLAAAAAAPPVVAATGGAARRRKKDDEENEENEENEEERRYSSRPRCEPPSSRQRCEQGDEQVSHKLWFLAISR